jgi:hypothetical protein
MTDLGTTDRHPEFCQKSSSKPLCDLLRTSRNCVVASDEGQSGGNPGTENHQGNLEILWVGGRWGWSGKCRQPSNRLMEPPDRAAPRQLILGEALFLLLPRFSGIAISPLARVPVKQPTLRVTMTA